MVLICILVLHGMIHNVRIYAKHVKTKDNSIADSLSRFQQKRFEKLTKDLDFDKDPTKINDAIWPIDKIWMY